MTDMLRITLLLAALAAAPAAEIPSGYYGRWLAEVAVLATPDEPSACRRT